MGHEQSIGHDIEIRQTQSKGKYTSSEDFVLEKSIFNNVFEKDIRRIFIYKKAERLAKAIHLLTPAFAESVSLRNRADAIAMGLVDAAILSPSIARAALSRELLALSSILSIARTSALLSPMNADLVAREAHMLLQEVAEYEEPRLSFDEAPTLSGIAKKALVRGPLSTRVTATKGTENTSSGVAPTPSNKGHIKDRREAIMSVIKDKRKASIKDISTIIRGVSEKTIQRELVSLVAAGTVTKEGERRWSTYSLT